MPFFFSFFLNHTVWKCFKTCPSVDFECLTVCRTSFLWDVWFIWKAPLFTIWQVTAKEASKREKCLPQLFWYITKYVSNDLLYLDYTFFQKWIQNRRQLGFLPNLNMVDLPAQHPQLYCEILTTRRQEEQASSVSSAPSRLTPNMTAEERSGWNVWGGDEEDRRERHRWMEGKLVT